MLLGCAAGVLHHAREESRARILALDVDLAIIVTQHLFETVARISRITSINERLRLSHVLFDTLDCATAHMLTLSHLLKTTKLQLRSLLPNLVVQVGRVQLRALRARSRRLQAVSLQVRRG